MVNYYTVLVERSESSPRKRFKRLDLGEKVVLRSDENADEAEIC